MSLLNIGLVFLSLIKILTGVEQDLKQDKPNIIYFLIDDWGYNDVGYYGNTDTETPFIDTLVKDESIRLDKYYVLPECTATRCALLTGRYPIRYGMQAGILYYRSYYALSRREYLLSEEFQNQGYETHLVGKWHLGMMSYDYLPNQRGFDTFLGYYAGLIYYYSHQGIEDAYPNKTDFHWNNDGWEEPDRYSLYTYTDRMLNIIDDNIAKKRDSNNNDEYKPFFMYVGWQGSHTPSEAPDEYKSKYNENEHTTERQVFQAQTTSTDDCLRVLIEYLKNDAKIWDNTIVIVASDNGAEMGYGDNSPLRGSKFTLWEGGVRVPAFITGGYLPDYLKGSVIKDVAVHAVDWYPTLLSAANVNNNNYNTPNELDGIDLWNYLLSGGTNDKTSELKKDKLLPNKHIIKTNSDGKVIHNDVLPEESLNRIQNEHPEDLYIESTWLYTNDGVNTDKNERYILLNANNYDCDTTLGVCGGIIYAGRWKLLIGANGLQSTENGEPEVDTCFWHRDFAADTINDRFSCGNYPESAQTSDDCICSDSLCLFDLEHDVCEYSNVYDDNKELGNLLFNKLKSYYDEQTIALYNKVDAVAPDVAALRENFGYWKPWFEESYTYSGWQHIEFEELLEAYYQSGGKTVSDDNEERIHVVAGHSIHVSKYNNDRKNLFTEEAKSRILIFGIAFTLFISILIGGYHLHCKKINKNKIMMYDDSDVDDWSSNNQTNNNNTEYGSLVF